MKGNAIWLDSIKTSKYELYQYLLNTTDEDLYFFFKTLTFLRLNEINEVFILFLIFINFYH